MLKKNGCGIDKRRAGYVGTFLELLNPVPQLSKDPERLLTEEQRSFLESTAGKAFTAS